MPAKSRRALHPLAQRERVLARLSCNSDFEAATTRLLTQGGDPRIALNAQGRNAYGCTPRPDPALLQLGSSTGSIISHEGFQAAVALFRRLYGASGSYHQELARQRQELSECTGAARCPGTELVFAASGTDLHAIAVHLAAHLTPGRMQAVMVAPSETGSGVPDALAALHFVAQTAQGVQVTRGEPLGAAAMAAPVGVSLRQPDGSLRSQAEVDAEFAQHVVRQMHAAGGCLLVLADVSKTGLHAPSVACAAQLRQQYGERLSVLVDACQWRMSADTLQGYLAQDFMVAITGSKFVGGPAFCGALLLPQGVTQRARSVPLTDLVDYCARSDWPVGWQPARALGASANVGLLLRWEAALAELRLFNALPAAQVFQCLQAWGQAVQQRLSSDASFAVLPVPPLSRSGEMGWDSVQTIFPFQVFKPEMSTPKRALTVHELRRLCEQLRQGQGAGASVRVLLGQPVECGDQAGEPVAALRLCCSARMVTDAVRLRQPWTLVIEQTMQALDLVAELAKGCRD
ncbi:hypothetical protein [Rhodoferax sp.]|uniref:hypothetical protein n=1 Tax=Rhodoferax sp. TaxID=50421 RepID=UPI002626E826|nr:hypothetical protein [Rhodoferax sp.]MDD2808718.1 hypothetical protein [Rhodoferax sp.]